jgi:hypothetical protein
MHITLHMTHSAPRYLYHMLGVYLQQVLMYVFTLVSCMQVWQHSAPPLYTFCEDLQHLIMVRYKPKHVVF